MSLMEQFQTGLPVRFKNIQPQPNPVTVPFAEWLPDLPALANPGATVVLNVVPQEGSYGPFKDLSAQTNALVARCFGAISVRDASNNIYIYAGDASKLYEAVDNTFTDESKGGGYTLASDDVWEFASWDAGDVVIATNFTDPVQSIAHGGGGAGAFADMITSTNKPKAKHIAPVRDFVVLGNTSDATDGHRPHRVWWSAIGDHTDFDPDAATQCDYQDMPTGGWVQRVVGGVEYGVIFQSAMIRRMDYVGSPLIFEITPVVHDKGTPVPNSVIGYGRDIFFLSDSGFERFNGSQSTPIGSGKVDRTFWAEFDNTNKRSVSAAIDPINKLVCWAYPGTGSTGGLPNRILMYRWDTGHWARAEVDVEILIGAQTQGYTLDGLDAIGTDIDDSNVFSESFDSDVWKGGKFRFAGFDQTHKLGYFTGSNLAATLETAEARIFPGRTGKVRSVRPLIDGGTITVAVAGRALQTATATFGTAAAINSIGECSLRDNSRFQRYRASIAAGGTWSHAQGVEVTAGMGSKK